MTFVSDGNLSGRQPDENAKLSQYRKNEVEIIVQFFNCKTCLKVNSLAAMKTNRTLNLRYCHACAIEPKQITGERPIDGSFASLR